MEKKNVTFDDIAKFTGFSKTTISRFFNKPDSLTEKNQKIIKDALDKLGYQGQNQLARNLAKGKTEYIGVIIPNLYLHYFSHLLNNIPDDESSDSVGKSGTAWHSCRWH